jgi:hypothetical protein
MNHARRTARRQALLQQRRSVVKDQFRRGLMAERLEERSLMAADLGFHSELWNVVKPTDVNADGVVAPSDALAVINSLNSQGTITVGQATAEGEASAGAKLYLDVNNDGSVSPADALQVINELNGEGETPVAAYIVDAVATATSTVPITSIRAGQDFYVRLRVADLRGVGNSGGLFSAYTDLLYDKSLGSVAPGEHDQINLPVPLNPDFSTGTKGTFTLTVGSVTTAPINFDTTLDLTVPGTVDPNTAAIQNALNAALPHPVTVITDTVNTPYSYVVLFSNQADVNVNQPPMTASLPSVVTSTLVDGDQFFAGVQYSLKYPNGQSANDAADRIDELGAFAGSNPTGSSPVEVLRVHMIATLPTGQASATAAFTPDFTNIETPSHDTLVFGNNAAVPYSQVTTSPGSILVTSGPINAVADTASVDEDAAGVTINVITNDTKNTGAPYGFIQLLSPQTFTVSPAGAGTVTAVDANNVKFVPAPNFSGTATFTYKAQISGDSNPDDTATGSVTVTVNGVNDAPSITVPGAQSGQEDVALAISGVSVADVDANDAATNPGLAVTVSATKGTVHVATSAATITGNDSASVTITGLVADVNTALAGLSYTGNTDFSGSDTLTVAANDNGNTGTGGAKTASKTIGITLAAVNDAPVNLVNSVAITGGSGDQQGIPGQDFHFNAVGLNQLSVNDVDAGSASLSTTLSLGSGQGTLSVTAAGGATVTGNGTASVQINGSQTAINATLADVTYTPVTGLTAATLTIATNDNGATGSGGAKTTTSTVNITLDPGNRPYAVPDRFTLQEGLTTQQQQTLDVLGNDFKSANATTTFISAVTQPAQGHLDISTDGLSLLYTPPADTDFFTPNAPLTFTYTIDDDDPESHGSDTGKETSTATSSITIANVADTPVATNDNFGTAIGVALPSDPLRNVLGNDTDVDNNYGKSDVAILTVLGAPKTIATSGGGSVVIAANGTFAYTPAAGFLGDDTFAYQAHSSLGPDSAAATVKIHVSSPPVVSDSTATAQEDTPLNIDISGNYTDPTEGRALGSVEIVANVPASAGTVAVAAGNKSFTYTPAANFNTTRPAASPITFTYIARAADGTPSNTATVSITVNEVNDNPTAVDDTFLGVKKQAGGVGVDQPILNVLNNDSIAPDVSETLKVTAVNGTAADAQGNTSPVATTAGGSVRLSNFQILYTSPTVTGNDSFTYTASDYDATTGTARGGSANATVNVNVVDFVPKTISGYVYLDKDGSGTQGAGESSLAGVQVTLTGKDFLGNNVSLVAYTDATGKYVFPQAAGQPGVPSTDPNDFLKPPAEGTTYTISEGQPKYLANGTSNNLLNNNLVTGSDSVHNSFTVGWQVTDVSGNIQHLDFTERGVDATSLTNANGFVTELFSTSSQDGLIFGLQVGVAQPMWTMQLGTTWAKATNVLATLDASLTKLTMVVNDGAGSHNFTLYQDPTKNTGALAGSTARFRILGIGQNGQYIIRVDATSTQCGLSLVSGQTVGTEGEGEGIVDGDYSQAADALFSSWA